MNKKRYLYRYIDEEDFMWILRGLTWVKMMQTTRTVLKINTTVEYIELIVRG